MPGRKHLFELFVRADGEWVYVTDLSAGTKSEALLLAVMVLKEEHAHLEIRVQEKPLGPKVDGSFN